MFSIVIPTYNRALDLRRCLDSLVNQTWKDFEVIVCDDGSTDDTSKVCREYSQILRLKYIFQENWGGPASPRNKGVHAAEGEWICFLDSDDWWYPQKLQAVTRWISSFDIVYHDLDEYNFPDKSNGRKRRGRNLKEPVFQDLLLNGNCIANSSVSVRKKILDEVGPLSENLDLVAVEDYDMWLRIAKFTDRFKYIPESLGAYWVGGGNITQVSLRQLRRKRSVLSKHWHDIPRNFKREVLKRFFYERGTIYLKLGMFPKARKMFLISIWSKSFKVFLRSFIRFCVMLIFRK